MIQNENDFPDLTYGNEESAIAKLNSFLEKNGDEAFHRLNLSISAFKGNTEFYLTPLCFAVIKNYVHLAARLLEIGVDVNAGTRCSTDVRYDNLSPLLLACSFAREEMIRLLIDRHANLLQRDSAGYNALTSAKTPSLYDVIIQAAIAQQCLKELLNLKDENNKPTYLTLAQKGDLDFITRIVKIKNLASFINISQFNQAVKTVFPDEQLFKANLHRIQDFLKINTLDSKEKWVIWLHCQNILTMLNVCKAFQRGSLYYGNEFKHDKYLAETSMTTLKPIQFSNGQKTLTIDKSYMINDTDTESAKTLSTILYGRTKLECNGSVQLAFYVSLLKFLQRQLGKDRGTKLFDKIFAAKPNDQHNLNRLRIGVMGLHINDDWFSFSPITFFVDYIKGPNLEELTKNPDLYIGNKFYIIGHHDYSFRHPEGAAAGWNVIFVGLNLLNEPLFLAAREYGKNYILTYAQLIELLKKEYASFPAYQQENFRSNDEKNNGDDFILDSCIITFSPSKLKLLLTDSDACLAELSQYCDDWYNNHIKAKGFVCLPSNVESKYFNSDTLQHKTQDDLALKQMAFFGGYSRPKSTDHFTQDDMRLEVPLSGRRLG